MSPVPLVSVQPVVVAPDATVVVSVAAFISPGRGVAMPFSRHHSADGPCPNAAAAHRPARYAHAIENVQSMADELDAMDPLDVSCSPSRFAPGVTPEKLHMQYRQAARWINRYPA